jgi:hypothetical protein
MSRASSMYPIGDVLVRGENLDASNLYSIGYVPVSGENLVSESTGSWSSVNPTQDSFLTKYFPGVRAALSKIREISGIVSRSADEINSFLASRGFSMKLKPFGADSIGFASVLDLVVEWMTEGTRTLVRSVTSGREFTAVRLTDGVRFCRSDNHTHPIALIATKSGDLVAMTKLDSIPNGEFALEELAGQLTRDAYQVYNEFGAVVFPMVNLNRNFDVSWLLGMELNGDPITQAIGQVKLRMNEKGARAQAAVAIVVTRSMSPRTFEDMVIDGAFLIWFIRQEFDSEQQYVPLFVAHVTEEDWADPGDLSVA